MGFTESVLSETSKFSKLGGGKQVQMSSKILLNNEPRKINEDLSMSSSEYASPSSHDNTQQTKKLKKLHSIENNSGSGKGSFSSEKDGTSSKEQDVCDITKNKSLS